MLTKKRLAAALMACVMCLSLATAAFAAAPIEITDTDALAEGTEIEITGTTEAITIKVVVPVTGAVVLNPYELDYEVEGSTVNDQVISAVQYIENWSGIDIYVDASVTGTAEGNAKFADAAVSSGDSTDNEVYLHFDIAAATVAANDSDKTQYDVTDPTSWTEVPVSTEAAETSASTKMDKMTAAVENTNPDMPGIAAFKLDGDAVKNPATPWTADDTVGVTVVLTFATADAHTGG